MSSTEIAVWRLMVSDHYATLGVPREADPDAVKKAYRDKAKALHPDREGGDAKAMAEVNRAYDVLGDPAKREQYDRTGTDGNVVTPEAQAAQRLMHLFDSYLNEDTEFEGDLVAQFQKILAANNAAVKDGMNRARVKLRKLERSAKRLAGPSLFATLVADKVRHQQQLLAVGESELHVNELVRQLLTEYRDTQPSPTVRTFNMSTADGSSALFAHLMNEAASQWVKR